MLYAPFPNAISKYFSFTQELIYLTVRKILGEKSAAVYIGKRQKRLIRTSTNCASHKTANREMEIVKTIGISPDTSQFGQNIW